MTLPAPLLADIHRQQLAAHVQEIETAFIDGHISSSQARAELMQAGICELGAFAIVHRIKEGVEHGI